MQRSRQHSKAFTLLELVLVLLVIAIIAGMVAPRLMGFARGRDTENAALQIMSMLRYARGQAVADSAVYTFNMDTKNGTYWVAVETGPEDQIVSTPVENSLGNQRSLPEGITMSFTPGDTTQKTNNQTAEVIHFYEDGRTETGTIVLKNDETSTSLVCPSATDSFHIEQGVR